MRCRLSIIGLDLGILDALILNVAVFMVNHPRLGLEQLRVGA